MKNITNHQHFEEKYMMYVVCGQQQSLKTKIRDNLKAFIRMDLTWFQIISLVLNILLFLIFLFIFESRLQARVTKPIQELTNQIRNPKEFFAKKQKIERSMHRDRASSVRKDDQLHRADTMVTADSFAASPSNRAMFSESARSTSAAEKREGTEVSRYSSRKSMEKKKRKSDKNESIDEVRALEGLFYSFFGSQAKSQQKNVLVEMSRHECSPNPFYVPKAPKDRHPNNVQMGEGEQDD